MSKRTRLDHIFWLTQSSESTEALKAEFLAKIRLHRGLRLLLRCHSRRATHCAYLISARYMVQLLRDDDPEPIKDLFSLQLTSIAFMPEERTADFGVLLAHLHGRSVAFRRDNECLDEEFDRLALRLFEYAKEFEADAARLSELYSYPIRVSPI